MVKTASLRLDRIAETVEKNYIENTLSFECPETDDYEIGFPEDKSFNLTHKSYPHKRDNSNKR
jgi:hypothetical protein